MRPGQVFIILIVQESWINALAENELGRIRPAGWPAAEFGRANGVSSARRAHAAVRVMLTPWHDEGGASAVAYALIMAIVGAGIGRPSIWVNPFRRGQWRQRMDLARWVIRGLDRSQFRTVGCNGRSRCSAPLVGCRAGAGRRGGSSALGAPTPPSIVKEPQQGRLPIPRFSHLQWLERRLFFLR